MSVKVSAPFPVQDFKFGFCLVIIFQMTHVIRTHATMVVNASMMSMELLTACVHQIGVVVSGVVSLGIHAVMVRCACDVM